jgi:hypothetical protein
MSRSAIVIALLSSLLWPQSNASFAAKDCHEHPKLVGSCFEVNGRLSVYNGAPSLRIWRVGTRRMLGISEQRFALEGFRKVPEEVEQAIKPEVELFGIYTVCPFTRQKQGEMQLVCVDKVKNLSVRKRPEQSSPDQNR